jgi:hypothetical protein
LEQQIKLGKEALFFVLAVMVSFLFWFVLATITEQNIIASDYLYMKEKNAFIITIGVIYFIRLNAWMTE